MRTGFVAMVFVSAGSIMFLLRFLVALRRDQRHRRTYHALVLTVVEDCPSEFRSFPRRTPRAKPSPASARVWPALRSDPVPVVTTRLRP